MISSFLTISGRPLLSLMRRFASGHPISCTIRILMITCAGIAPGAASESENGVMTYAPSASLSQTSYVFQPEDTSRVRAISHTLRSILYGAVKCNVKTTPPVLRRLYLKGLDYFISFKHNGQYEPVGF